MARHIAYLMASTGEASLDDLLLSLRNELREVLGLERLQGNPVHTRVVLTTAERGGDEFPREQADGQKVAQSSPGSSSARDSQVSL
jgi:hypothetical protein